jgi:hypothetical protein
MNRAVRRHVPHSRYRRDDDAEISTGYRRDKKGNDTPTYEDGPNDLHS